MSVRPIKIAPSILAYDLGNLREGDQNTFPAPGPKKEPRCAAAVGAGLSREPCQGRPARLLELR